MSDLERSELDELLELSVARAVQHLSRSNLSDDELALIEADIRSRASQVISSIIEDREREVAAGAKLSADWAVKVTKLRLFDIEAIAAAQARLLDVLPAFSPRLMSVVDILRYVLNDDRQIWIEAGFRATVKISPGARSQAHKEWRNTAWILASRSASEHVRRYETASAAFLAQHALHNRYDHHMKQAFDAYRRTARWTRVREWFLGPRS